MYIEELMFQAAKFSPEVVQENVELLLECLPQRHNWRPVSNFMRLGGIQLLMELVSLAVDWTSYTGKSVLMLILIDSAVIIGAIIISGMVKVKGCTHQLTQM